MSFLNWIVEDLNSASDFFYDIYLEVQDWIWPLWLAAEFFYSLSRVFNWLAWDFSEFAGWVYDTAGRLGDILSWGNIRSLIRGWLPDLEGVVDWWSWWWVWVGQEIDAWWSGTGTMVQGWIAAAIAELEGAWEDWLYFWNITWPAWLAQFETLRASWDNFWAVTLPTLVTFTWLSTWWTSTMGEVQDLIDSAFTVRDSLWSGWQELRDQVVEFFTDPWAWLYNRFDDFIERFW